MKSALILTLVLCSMISLCAQQKPPKTKSLQMAIGQTWHYTGDIPGVVFEASHNYYINPKISLANAVAATIHWAEDSQFNGLTPGASPSDRSLTIMKAGLQYNPHVRYAFLVIDRHQLMIHAGGVARFETRSYPQFFRYSQGTDVDPEPFYVFYNERSRQTSIAVGYSFGAQYQYSTPKIDVGLNISIQYDTRGDGLSMMKLYFARKYRQMQ